MRLHLMTIMSLSLLLGACEYKERTPPAKKSSGGHHHEAPRGGTLVELGDHYANLEVLLDATKGEMKVYALDSHAENPVRLTATEIPLLVQLGDTSHSLTLAATANTLSGETVGDTSEFTVTDPKLSGVSSFKAEIPLLTVKGTTLTSVKFAYPAAEKHSH